jgi:omega-amidase
VRDLTAALVQHQLAWEDPQDNRRQFGDLIDKLGQTVDLVVLPEMFTTGFSMNAIANAEEPGGPTEQWLLELAGEKKCALTGSVAIRADGGVYNRMLFATPDGIQYYDKRHLFRMAGEHRRYLQGSERIVVQWRDWRILLQVCYDLRFPVFCRNREDYDLALFVANWPAKRRLHWRQLLIARAIENQACVIGVNRIGADANGLDYSGDSLAVAANGELLVDMENRDEVAIVTLNGQALQDYRESFPCHLDADGFRLD